MDSMEAHVGKMEEQLKRLGAKLDELVAMASKVGVDAREDYRARVEALKAQHRAAQHKLDEAKVAGHEKWGTFKVGVDGAWRDLEAAFTDLKN